MSKELAKKEEVASYMVLSNQGASDLLKENLGDGALTPQDLERIKIPSGGQLAWEVPGLEGPEYLKSFEAVILWQNTSRVYWKSGLEEGNGNTPPDCNSRDGVTGVGAPGGLCAACPLNQFDTGKNGKGKACKEQKPLFIFRPTDAIPLVIPIPPSSLKEVKKYMIKLAAQQKGYWQVVTRFELVAASNAQGIKYAQAKLTFAGDLPADQVASFTALRQQMIPTFKNVQIIAEDVDAAKAPSFN